MADPVKCPGCDRTHATCICPYPDAVDDYYGMPPEYMGAETCAECWEPFGWSVWPGITRFDRFFHRRRWGHNPVVLSPQPTAAEQHQENVAAARRYQEARRGR